jgi:hypothetical protein
MMSLALGLGIAALASTPALAVTVEYSTSGSFSPSQWPAITFHGYSGSDTVTPTLPAYDTLGTFRVRSRNYTADSVPFDLTITETSPSSGTGDFTGTLTGTITHGNGGGLSITFDQTAVTIGTETYELQGASPFAIANHGRTSLNAEILTTVGDAPEPTFYLLTGTAFAGLLAMAIRRRRQTV